MVARKVSSKKHKARTLQKIAAKDIREVFNLPDEDAISRPMGSGGSDVIMSRAAIEKFPFSVECRNQEKINVWSSFEDCERNAKKDKRTALLMIKRNFSDPMIVMKWKDLLTVLKNNKTPVLFVFPPEEG